MGISDTRRVAPLFEVETDDDGGAVTTPESDTQLPLVERLDPSLDAVEVFLRLSALPHVVFFDSAMRHPELGRYSFIAADPVEWLEVPADGSDAFSLINAKSSILSNDTLPNLPPFQGGWAGAFGYELAGSLELTTRMYG